MTEIRAHPRRLVATDQRSPDADPRHYAIAIVKKASGRARSDRGNLHLREGMLVTVFAYRGRREFPKTGRQVGRGGQPPDITVEIHRRGRAVCPTPGEAAALRCGSRSYYGRTVFGRSSCGSIATRKSSWRTARNRSSQPARALVSRSTQGSKVIRSSVEASRNVSSS